MSLTEAFVCFLVLLLVTFRPHYTSDVPKSGVSSKGNSLLQNHNSIHDQESERPVSTLISTIGNHSNASVVHLKKHISRRYLRWNGNKIESINGDDMTVRFLQPYVHSERLDKRDSFIGFTVYKLNGEEVVPETGVFQYVTLEHARDHAKYCFLNSDHSGAYHYLYGRCPEDEDNLVASGHCYAKGDLRFNSRTFNCIQSFSDESYYEESNIRYLNSVEKDHFMKCFHLWEANNYRLDDWKCPVSGNVRIAPVSPANPEEECGPPETPCEDCENIKICTGIGSKGIQSPAVVIVTMIVFSLNTFT